MTMYGDYMEAKATLEKHVATFEIMMILIFLIIIKQCQML